MRGRFVAGMLALAALGAAAPAQAAESLVIQTSPTQAVAVPLAGGLTPAAHTAATTLCSLSGLQKSSSEGPPASGAQVCWLVPDLEGASEEVVGIGGVASVWTSMHGSARAGDSSAIILKLGSAARP